MTGRPPSENGAFAFRKWPFCLSKVALFKSESGTFEIQNGLSVFRIYVPTMSMNLTPIWVRYVSERFLGRFFYSSICDMECAKDVKKLVTVSLG